MRAKEKVTQQQVEKIRKYYCKCKLWLPSDCSWRYFLFKLPNGKYKRFHLKSKKELRKLLVKYTPIRVFYSAGCWLNVENIRGRVKTPLYPIKIYSDVIIDIDDKDFKKARESALEVVKRIGKPDYILKTFRGLHLAYYKQGKNKNKYLGMLKDIENFDKKTLENEFNVFSLPLTLNKGIVMDFLSLNQLKNSDFTHFKACRGQKTGFIKIYTHLNANDEAERHKKANEELNTSAEIDKNGIVTASTIHSFPNQVKKNLFIPILKYSKEFIKAKSLYYEIKGLSEKYDLGSFYVFENEDYICFISLKCVEERRLEKILNCSRSFSKEEFKKFNKIWFDFSDYNFVGQLNYGNEKFLRISKKHYHLLKAFGNIKFNEMVGNENINIVEVDKNG